MIWLVQKEKLYGQKDEPFCELVSTEGQIFGQKIEAFCDLIGTEANFLRTESRTNL